MIKYSLFKTSLGNVTRHVAKVSSSQTISQSSLAMRIAQLRTSVSAEDVDSVLSLLKSVVSQFCQDGFIVSLDGFVRFSPAIGGAFDGPNDGFTDPRNQAYVNATVALAFNDSFNKKVEVLRIPAANKLPRLAVVKDLTSATENQKVTKRGIVTIVGERLQLDPTRPEEYLRFVNAEQINDFAQVTLVQKVSSTELIFQMPETTFVKGYFEVGASFGTSALLIGKSTTIEVAV